MPFSILVIGAENPRVRELIKELGHYAKVSWMNVGPMPRQLDLTDAAARQIEETIRKQFGRPDVIMFTWPQLAPLAQGFPDIVRAYYCKDPFEFWPIWNRDQVQQLETELLGVCDIAFAISRRLCMDFALREKGKVCYLPNGVEGSFLTAGKLPRPANLPDDMPILGSVGEINETYDWDFISDLAAGLPEVRLCFVGEILQAKPGGLQDVITRLSAMPNVSFLGKQPHDQVLAYMQHFDIATCFLRADDYGNRRSPLRLYDYLATDRPIISTPISEALEHRQEIHIANTAGEAIALSRRILRGELPVKIAFRQKYIAGQTWACRAQEMLVSLLSLPQLAHRRQDFDRSQR